MTTGTKHQLSVMPGPDEELLSPNFQEELREILHNLEAQDFKVSARVRVQKSIESGGPWLLGGFVIVATATKAAIEAIGVVAGEFVKARTGRRVKLKIGGIEAEAHNVEELRKVLQLADEFQQKQPYTRAGTSHSRPARIARIRSAIARMIAAMARIVVARDARSSTVICGIPYFLPHHAARLWSSSRRSPGVASLARHDLIGIGADWMGPPPSRLRHHAINCTAQGLGSMSNLTSAC